MASPTPPPSHGDTTILINSDDEDGEELAIERVLNHSGGDDSIIVTRHGRRGFNNNDNSICTICGKEYVMEGGHRMVALRCGHIFGKRCVVGERIRVPGQKPDDSQIFYCPICKQLSNNAVTLFVRGIKVLDTDNSRMETLKAEVHKLEQQEEELKQEVRLLELELEEREGPPESSYIQRLRNEVDRLEKLLEGS